MDLRSLLTGIMALGTCTAPLAYSINLTGTRVILQEARGETTLQLRNQGQHSRKVQLFVERPQPEDEPQTFPQTSAMPVQTYPSLVRIQPNTTQRVHVVLQPNDLPHDRESLLWLNVLEEPQPVRADSGEAHVLIQSRIKLFYRPSGLQETAVQAHRQLAMQLATKEHGPVLHLRNLSAYHITLKQLRVIDTADAGDAGLWAEPQAWHTTMLAPHGRASIALKVVGNRSPREPMAELTVINDLGGLTRASLPLAPMH